MVLRKGKKKQLSLCGECGKSNTPAIDASRYGHEDCLVTAYHELGVFNERDNFGATPVHYAARFGQLACLKWLVTNSGISANALAQNGMTAAHDAAALGQLQCLQYLLERTHCSAKDRTLEGATVLHIACKFGRVEVVRWLVEEGGCSPGEKGGNDVTPVHLCAARDQLACLKYLTSHRHYKPNELTVHGATPVYFAAQEGCLESLQWLVVHGQGDALQPAADGMAPVHAAAQAGQLDCLQWLVEVACVSPRLKSGDGATPVHFAAASGKVSCLEWLLQHGAHVSDVDNLGGTPVHDAAEQGYLEVLQLLILHGGDVTVADNEGIKPIDLAREHGFDDCVHELFRAAKTSVTTSLVPDPPRRRRSSDDMQARQTREDRQRDFEDALMSGVSEAQREHIWQEAAKVATTPEPGLKLLLEADDLPAHMEAAQFEDMGRSHHSHHSRKSAKRSASSYKGLFQSAEPLAKQRLALSPHLFDTPPMSNVEIAPKRDSKIETQKEVRCSFAEVPDLVDTTDGDHEEERKEDAAERIEMKEMKPPSGFLKWFFFRKKREPPESGKEGGAPVKKRLKTKFYWGKKKASSEEREANKVDVSRQEESGEVKEHAAQKVAESVQLSAQEVETKSEQQSAGEEEDEALVEGMTATEGLQEQSMDICSLPNASPLSYAEVGDGERSRRDPEDEEEPVTPPAGAVTSQSGEMTATNLSRSASAERIVIREGRGNSRTPENAVNIDFIKLRSVYHKCFSEFKDSDFPSPEGSDTEEGKTARHTGTRSFGFEHFGVEVGPGSRGPSPIPKSLETEFEMGASPSYEGDVSALNESTLTDIAIPVEVDLSIDFTTKDILEVSFHDKTGSPPLPDAEQDAAEHTSGFKTPPNAAPSVRQSALELGTPVDDHPAGKTPEALGGEPVLQRKRSSVKNLAQMFESASGTPSSTPLKRITTPKTFTASGDVVRATPSGRDTIWDRIASTEDTPIATPSKGSTTPMKIASSGDTATATPTEGDSTSKSVASVGDTATTTPTERDAAAKQVASLGDTPTATPTEKDTAAKQVASLGDTTTATHTERDAAAKQVASLGDTPTVTPTERDTAAKWVASLGDTTTATPTERDAAAKQVASLGDTPTVTPTERDTAAKWVASLGDTPTVTPTERDTAAKGVASIGDTPTERDTAAKGVASIGDTPTERDTAAKGVASIGDTPTERDTAAKGVASIGDTPTERDAAAKGVASIGDTPTATPTKGGSAVVGIASSGDTPTKGSTAPIHTASPADTPTQMDSEVTEADEGGDVLTPLKRVSTASLRRSSATTVGRDWIDGSPSDDKGEGTAQFVPSVSSPSKGVLSAFMHSGDIKHLNLIKFQHNLDQANLADRVAQDLLAVPTPNDEMEAEMQKHVLCGVLQPKVYLAKGSQLKELTAQEKFEQGMDYLCFQVECGYPPQAHVFLLTSNTEEPAEATVALVKKTIRSLPGRPILYREVFGHESAIFRAHFSNWCPKKHKSKPYLNLCAPGTVQLYRYSDGHFLEEALNYFSLTEGEVFVLDTPLRVYIRVIPSVWSEEVPSNPLTVAKEFLTKQEYPEWAPVAIVTKYGEPQSFVSQFPTWPHADLRLAGMATELKLPEELEAVQYSSTGRMKIWKLDGDSKTLVSLDEFGHFYSSHCYMVECIHGNHHQLYLWIGSGISLNKVNEEVMDQVNRHRAHVKGKSQMVIVPEGKETDRYLSLFKGKLIIHNPAMEGPNHLFRVSGASTLRMCVREVQPLASSLHSSHTFIAYTVEELYVWSGQFSPPHERRGALVVVRMLDPDFLEPTGLVTEGQETEEFWSTVSGKGPHPYLDAAKLADYVPGRLYLYKDCEFWEKFNYTKDDLTPKQVFALWKSDLLFIWRGSQVKLVYPLDVATDFTAKFFPGKSAIKHLVVSCEEQGNESQDFWSIFSLAEKAILQVHMPPKAVVSPPVAVERSLDEEEEEEEDGDGSELGAREEDEGADQDGLSATPSFTNLFESDARVFILSEESKATRKTLQKSKDMVTVLLSNRHGERLTVCVSARATIVSILLKLAMVVKVEASRDLALFEVLDSLGIERQVEDHETIGDIVGMWPKKKYGYFIVREVHGKYKLWTRPSLPKSDIRNCLRKNEVPALCASFAHRKLSGGKWKQETVMLERDGIHTVVLSGEGMDCGRLVCGLQGHHLYMLAQATGKKRTGITHYGFALKPISSFKSRDVTVFSAGDETTLNTWVEGIQLVKYGSQLKANYHAMSQALGQHTEEHSVGIVLATEEATSLSEAQSNS